MGPPVGRCFNQQICFLQYHPAFCYLPYQEALRASLLATYAATVADRDESTMNFVPEVSSTLGLGRSPRASTHPTNFGEHLLGSRVNKDKHKDKKE
jgi:hypothetical protein